MWYHLLNAVTVGVVGVGVVFPLYFWLIPAEQRRGKTMQIFQTLEFIVVCCGLIGLLFIVASHQFKLAAGVWGLVVAAIVSYSWRKEPVSALLWMVVPLFGFNILIRAMNFLVQIHPVFPAAVITLIATGILAGGLILLIVLLQKETVLATLRRRIHRILGLLIGLRFLWDGISLLLRRTEDSYGSSLTLVRFLLKSDTIYMVGVGISQFLIPILCLWILERNLYDVEIRNCQNWITVGLLISLLVAAAGYQRFLFLYGLAL